MIRITIAGLLAGTLVFFAGAFSHMVLQLEGRGFGRLADEAKVEKLLVDLNAAPGIYGVPEQPENYGKLAAVEREKVDLALNERYRKGPNAMLIVAPAGEDMMGPTQLVGEWLTNVAGGLIVAVIVSLFDVRVGFVGRWLAVTGFGLFTWLSTSASFLIWYRFPQTFIVDGLWCALIEWALAGLVIAALLPIRKPLAPELG